MSAADLALMEARNVKLTLRVDGSAGRGITASDIAGALGFVNSDFPSLLLRAKYLMDEDSGRLFLRRLRGYIHITSAVERWDLTTREVSNIAHALFLEAVSPSLCVYCNGNRGVILDRRWTKCTGCKGTGINHRTDDEMAQSLDSTRSAWQKHEAFYVRLLAKIRAWEVEGLILVATARKQEDT